MSTWLFLYEFVIYTIIRALSRVLLRIVEENHLSRTVPADHPPGVYMRGDFGAIKSNPQSLKFYFVPHYIYFR